MSKCKFCKQQAFMSIKKYGYNRFGVCPDCFKWVLIEIDNFKDAKNGDVEK